MYIAMPPTLRCGASHPLKSIGAKKSTTDGVELSAMYSVFRAPCGKWCPFTRRRSRVVYDSFTSRARFAHVPWWGCPCCIRNALPVRLQCGGMNTEFILALLKTHWVTTWFILGLTWVIYDFIPCDCVVRHFLWHSKWDGFNFYTGGLKPA